MVASNDLKKKRLYKGEVVSDKMDKTIVVLLRQTYVHPKLQKVLRRIKKYKVHDEENKAKVGDIVEFYQVRPLSKEKYMSLHKIVAPATQYKEV